MAAMTKPQRILVQLKKGKESLGNAHFTQCISDFFGHKNGIGKVFAYMEDNSLFLSDVQQSNEENVILKHPSFCPIHKLTPTDIKGLPDETASRGVDVGAAVLVESCDGKVLLIKRAKHLRTFPGIWVPPGGHMEIGESLIDAGLRELEEETGLTITLQDCVDEKIRLIALWESAFPPKLALGLPKRHHIVTYLHASLKEGLNADILEKRIKFDPEEVEACAWLNRDFIDGIVHSCEETQTSLHQNKIPPKFSAIVENEDKQQVQVELPSGPLLATMGEDSNAERVSTGTKFALEEYLKLL